MRRSELESAIRLREGGTSEAAESLLSRVLAGSPDDAEANHQMAWLYDIQGREREAVPFYVRAVAGDLSDEERRGALLGLGSTYRALGEYPEAVEVLRQGVSEFPADRAMQTFLALALYNTGEHQAGGRPAAQAPRRDHVGPGDKILRKSVALLHRQAGRGVGLMPEKVLVTREIPEAGLRILEDFDVTVLHERPPERDELLDAVRGAPASSRPPRRRWTARSWTPRERT